MVRTVGIVGLGLIGGSLAKAIRQYTGCHLLGADRDQVVLDRAVAEGVLAGELTAERLAECDLVIVALYPEAAVNYIIRHCAFFRRGGLVMDCGGVKSVVCGPLEQVARENGFTFIGGHPMAGTERSGYENAFPELFQGASLILTPYEGTAEEDIQAVWSLAAQLGFSRLTRSTPTQHDQIIAYTSQLAHVVSCAYVGSPTAPDFQGFSAGSFKDMTRVARLNEEMWTELFLENRDALVREINVLMEELGAMAHAIRWGQRDALREMLRRAREIKETIDKGR